MKNNTEQHEINPQTFRGGMPYEPDINRLKESFPVVSLEEGRIIGHEELEAVLKYKRGTQRYYGVINSWLSKMQTEHKKVMQWKPGIGIQVLKPHEHLHSTEVQILQKIRVTGRKIKQLAYVDRARLDEDGKKRYDHIGRVVITLKTALIDARKDLPTEVPALKSLPKPPRPD